MRKLTDFIVKHCYVVFVVFLMIMGICGFLSAKVRINKDIYAYMPASSETSRGLAIMDDGFKYFLHCTDYCAGDFDISFDFDDSDGDCGAFYICDSGEDLSVDFTGRILRDDNNFRTFAGLAFYA